MQFPIQTPAPGIDAGARPVRLRASVLAVAAVLVASAAFTLPTAAHAEESPASDVQAVAAESPAATAVEAPVEQPTDAAVEPVPVPAEEPADVAAPAPAEAAAAEESATEEPAPEGPAVEEPAAEQPAVEESAAERPAPAGKSFAAASGPEALAAPPGPAEAGPGEPVNQPPVAVDDHYVVEQGDVLQVAAPGAMANDFDPDGDQTDFVHTNGALSGTFGWYTGLWMTYEPAPGFLGIDSTQYRIKDAHGAYSNWATITFEVVASDGIDNHPPVLAGETVIMFAGTTHVAAAPGVLANDVDPDGDQLFVLMKPTAWHYGLNMTGGLDMTADGAWTFTPPAGFVGNVNVDYSVTDGSVYATARLTIMVVEPIEPVDPAEPIEPVDPAEPIEPVDPAEPIEPVDPALPAEPAEPAEPGHPMEPTDPTEPGRPAEELAPLDENEPSDPAVRTEAASSDAAALAETGTDANLATALAALLVALGIALRLRRRAADH